MNEVVGVIPARYDSSRFPGKVLAELDGVSLIEHLYRRALEARTLTRVVVATDDERVSRAVKSFGGEVACFDGDFRCGSERVACLAEKSPGDIFVNIQADEPLMPPEVIDAAVNAFTGPEILMTTVVAVIREEGEWEDPNIVKTVVDRSGDALYFSRAPIPWSKETGGARPGSLAYKHLGVYGFRRDFLLLYARLEPGALEAIEGLEQMRVLEHGYRVRVALTPYDSTCVDTPADLEKISLRLKRRGK